MLIRDILLEYERERAAQALGVALWKQALLDDLGLSGRVVPDELDKIGTTRPDGPYGKRIAEVFSDPEKQRKLALDALAMIEKSDPTPNKKYTQWMARMFANGSEPSLEDVTSTLSDYVSKFHKLNTRRKLAPGENDINRYKSAKQLYLVMDRYEDPTDDADEGKARKVYEDGDVTVIVPEDEAAACRYGRKTRWCTAAVHGSNYFEHYNNQGPLYILIPKKPKHEGEKYQLHFATDQYMDENDDPVEIGTLLKHGFPGLLKFFMGKPEVAEHIQEMVQFASDELLQKLSDDIWELAQDKVNDSLTDLEVNDDYYIEWLKGEGYVDEEGDIDWDRAPSYTDYNDDARRWYLDMEEYLHPAPHALRRMAADQVSDGTFDEDSIYNIEEYIAHNLRWQMRKDAYGGDYMADWIDKNVMIRKTADGPKVTLIKR